MTNDSTPTEMDLWRVIARINDSMDKLVAAQEHQAISMKRLADHFCPPLATPSVN